jgi:sterol desaturase/sphingolipid hydroxylase (fatty acid hydroxylase superfamily)
MQTFSLIVAVALLFFLLEKLFPGRNLAEKNGWFLRALFFNGLQLLIVMVCHYTWESWIVGKSFYKFGEIYSPIVGGLIGYLINTWVFYWWHRLRHENKLCWNIFHQFHHSPERIELITSFYKHPLEIIMNSIIVSILVYPILGLTIDGNSWFSFFSAISEFFYHANIKTPRWIGYIIQRPESHCVHHLRDKRFCSNYSDFPLWDILGGTFYNPTDEFMEKVQTGFSNNKEMNIEEMMKCRDVLGKHKKEKMIIGIGFMVLLVIGCSNTVGYFGELDNIRGIAFATSASPLPLVFSAYNGVETFSTSFEFNITFMNGTTRSQMMDHKVYGMMKGPYNRKNMFGVALSHGPFFDKENMIQVRQQILHWGLCNPGDLAKEFGIMEKIKKVYITIKSKTKGNEDREWKIIVKCQ